MSNFEMPLKLNMTKWSFKSTVKLVFIVLLLSASVSMGLTKDIGKDSNFAFIDIFLYLALFMWIILSCGLLFISDFDTWFRNRSKGFQILTLLSNIQPLLYGLLFDGDLISGYLIYYLAYIIIIIIDQIKETKNFGLYLFYFLIIVGIVAYKEIFNTLLTIHMIFILWYLNPFRRLRKQYDERLSAGVGSLN